MLALRDRGAQAVRGAELPDREDVMDKRVLVGKTKAVRTNTSLHEDGPAVMKVLEHFFHGLEA